MQDRDVKLPSGGIADLKAATDRLGIHWIDHFLRGGHLVVPSPRGSGNLTITRVRAVSWNTMILFSDDLAAGVLVSSVLGIGFPIVGVVFLGDAVFVNWGPGEFGVSAQDLETFARWAASGLLPGERVSAVSVLIGHENFAHVLHNEVAGLERSHRDRAGAAIRIAEVIVTREPLGPLREALPFIREIPTRHIAPAAIGAECEQRPILMIGATQLSARARQDVIAFIDRTQPEQHPELCAALREAPRPILVLGFRSHSRVMGNLSEAYLGVVRRLRERYGAVTLILDGFSLPADYDRPDAYPGWFAWIAGQCGAVIEAFIPAAREAGASAIFSTADIAVPTALWMTRQADFYFTNQGTQQHKAGWFSDAYGVVHGPPDRLTPRDVAWFDGLVDGDRSFAVLPADLYDVDADSGDTSAGHRFRDPQEAAARVAELMIAHGLVRAPADQPEPAPDRPPSRWGRVFGRPLARRLTALMQRGIRPGAGSG
ncbi:hypothetical protein [Methylobacterium sp. ID0610]|uniref:hypothetical protein n=1 Tax=Methylobacterium carpenticola TaxID=3344827 RepID=UPI0036CCC98E